MLGRHCSVGSDSRVERSVLHDRVRVGADAVVVESVLGEGVRVGERALLEPGAIAGAGAVIGDGAVIGSGARLEPGAEVPARRARRGRGAGPMSDGMLEDVLAQPQQLGDALWRAQSAGIPKQDRPGGLVVCGMGGSAIGGDLATAALGDRATRPITTVRGYALESWTGPDSLVLCASYSGDTEETLACFEAAGVAGAGRVALTTGGKLAEAARAEGVPVIGVPGRDAAARGGRLHDRRRARVRRAVRRRAGAALGDRHRRRRCSSRVGPRAASQGARRSRSRGRSR